MWADEVRRVVARMRGELARLNRRPAFAAKAVSAYLECLIMAEVEHRGRRWLVLSQAQWATALGGGKRMLFLPEHGVIPWLVQAGYLVEATCPWVYGADAKMYSAVTPEDMEV